MTAKEYLRQYLEAENAITAKLDQIHKLRCLAAKTTSVLASDRIQSSESDSKLENIISHIVDMESEVDADIDQLQEIKRNVESVIFAVSDGRQQAVLIRHYINGQTWERIAVELNYTYRHTIRLHGKALLAIEQNMSLNVTVNK